MGGRHSLMQNMIMISSMPYMARRSFRGIIQRNYSSGAAGVLAGYPLDTVKVRIQTSPPGTYTGTFSCLADCVRCVEIKRHTSFFSAVGLQAGGGAGPLQGDDLAPIGGCGHQCCHIWGQCTGSGLNLALLISQMTHVCVRF